VTDRGLMRSSAVMAGGTLVSRVLGFARAIMLTSLLGVNAALAQDTFTTALAHDVHAGHGLAGQS